MVIGEGAIIHRGSQMGGDLRRSPLEVARDHLSFYDPS